MNIAIIPARGGSKRIPRKNIKSFCGKPIIAYSIEAALQADLFDHVVVSTDDAEISDIATGCGATVPFVRPAALAGDKAATRPVVNHAIEMLEQSIGKIDYACCIYPTAPFLLPLDIQYGYRLLIENDSDFSFTATEFRYPIQRALKVADSGEVAMFFPENRYKRSQDLQPAYHDAGQFYWGRSQAFKQDLPTFGSKSRPVLLPHYRVQDIDTPDDWHHAEMLYRVMNMNREASSDRISR